MIPRVSLNPGRPELMDCSFSSALATGESAVQAASKNRSHIPYFIACVSCPARSSSSLGTPIAPILCLVSKLPASRPERSRLRNSSAGGRQCHTRNHPRSLGITLSTDRRQTEVRRHTGLHRRRPTIKQDKLCAHGWLCGSAACPLHRG